MKLFLSALLFSTLALGACGGKSKPMAPAEPAAATESADDEAGAKSDPCEGGETQSAPADGADPCGGGE